MSSITHKITRTLTAAKAPLHAMLCSVLALGLVMMSSAWCCCLLSMPSQGSSVSDDAPAMAAADPASQATQPVAMLLTAGDQSCCIRPAKDSTNTSLPASPTGPAGPTSPGAPHDDAPCQCQGQMLDSPTEHLNVHNIASSISQPMLQLPRLTIAWQLPAATPSRISSHEFAPPEPGESSLLAQACLLTV